MNVGEVIATAQSAAWPAGGAEISVTVATHNRVELLDGLFDALAAQTARIEVVIADDGSIDGTWGWLESYAARTSLPLLALRLHHTGGPSVPRNTAVAHARTPLLAVTDDDCLPEREWAASLATALHAGAPIVQGRTRPVQAQHGPWDRTVSVSEPSGLFETCNLGIARPRFVELGGFPSLGVLRRLPRGFGEDVVLGALMARGGGSAWAPDAVVEHRWIPGSYADHLRGLRRLTGFPWLAREVPEVAQQLHGRVFLSARTIEYDAALAGVVAAAAARRPVLLLAAAPWLRRAVANAQGRPGRPLAVRIAQQAVADGVGLLSLVQGSVRHRRLVV